MYISTKEIKLEHTKRIGIMLGVNLQYASIIQCKNYIKDLYQIKNGIIKIKKRKYAKEIMGLNTWYYMLLIQKQNKQIKYY